MRIVFHHLRGILNVLALGGWSPPKKKKKQKIAGASKAPAMTIMRAQKPGTATNCWLMDREVPEVESLEHDTEMRLPMLFLNEDRVIRICRINPIEISTS